MKSFLNWLKQNKDAVSAVMAVVLLYALMGSLGITCPIKFVTGVSCAGCGMTRAWLALLSGNIDLACYYHPLFFMPPAALLLFYFRKRMPKTFFYSFLFIIAAFFVIVYAYRMIYGSSDIVVFEPENGLIYKLISEVLIFFQNLKRR